MGGGGVDLQDFWAWSAQKRPRGAVLEKSCTCSLKNAVLDEILAKNAIKNETIGE